MAVGLGFNGLGSGAPYISQTLQNLNDPSALGTYHLAGDLWMNTGWLYYRVFGSVLANGAYNPEAKTLFWGQVNRAGVQVFPLPGISIVAGLSQSTFDFEPPNVDAVAGMGPTNSNTVASTFSYGMNFLGAASNTSSNGIPLLALKTQFGSGWTATISLEENEYRRNSVWDAGADALVVGAMPPPEEAPSKENRGSCSATSIGNSANPCLQGDYAAQHIPDIVGSLRVDQAWGSAQIAGALHQIRAGYYGNNFSASSFGPGGYTGVAPEDKWGSALMAGVVINLPWAPGDRLWINGTYTSGAMSYMGMAQTGLFGLYNRFDGANLAAGWAVDAIFGNTISPATPTTAGTVGAPSGIQLTTGVSISAAIEHYWTPSLRTSLWGTWNSVDFNGTATQIFCESPVGSVRTVAGATPNFATGAVIGCNPDFQVWGVGTRTIWNPVRNLDVGIEVMYTKLEQNMDPNTTRFNFFGGPRPGLYIPKDQDIWSGVVRLQRNFWP
jgi:hypothetical protein